MSRLKIAAIAGATGLTGSYLIKLLVDDQRYELVYVLGRRAPELSSSKIVFLQTTFGDLDEMTLEGVVDDLYCTLGTTIKKAGSQAAFRQIDCEAVIEFAKWGNKYGAQKMVVISSIGANAHSGNFYLRTKGEMENLLKIVGFETLVIVRPSLIVGNRQEKRAGEKLGTWILKLFNPLLIGRLRPYRSINASQLARAMHELGSRCKGDIFVVLSDELQTL